MLLFLSLFNKLLFLEIPESEAKNNFNSSITTDVENVIENNDLNFKESKT